MIGTSGEFARVELISDITAVLSILALNSNIAIIAQHDGVIKMPAFLQNTLPSRSQD